MAPPEMLLLMRPRPISLTPFPSQDTDLKYITSSAGKRLYLLALTTISMLEYLEQWRPER
eukprot:scaffold41439_cov51-Cyclotella_meneghiniana.AAC.9